MATETPTSWIERYLFAGPAVTLIAGDGISIEELEEGTLVSATGGTQYVAGNNIIFQPGDFDGQVVINAEGGDGGGEAGKVGTVNIDTAQMTGRGGAGWPILTPNFWGDEDIYSLTELEFVVDVDWFYDSNDDIFIGGITAIDERSFSLVLTNTPKQLYQNHIRLQHNQSDAGNYRFWSPTMRDVLIAPGESVRITYNAGTAPHSGFSYPYNGSDNYWYIHAPTPRSSLAESAYFEPPWGSGVSGTNIQLKTADDSPYGTYHIDTLLVQAVAGTTVSYIQFPSPKVNKTLRVRNGGTNDFSFVEPGSMTDDAIYVRTNFSGGSYQPVVVAPGTEALLVYSPRSNSGAGAWVLLK